MTLSVHMLNLCLVYGTPGAAYVLDEIDVAFSDAICGNFEDKHTRNKYVFKRVIYIFF